MSELETNLQTVEKLLAPLRAETLPHFIDGKSDPGRSGNTFEGYTPVDNSVIGKVAAGNAADIDAACRAAETAFEEWGEMPLNTELRLYAPEDICEECETCLREAIESAYWDNKIDEARGN